MKGLRLGKTLDLGPAYPVTATSRGVVARTGRDQIVGYLIDGGMAGHLPSLPDAKEDRTWGPSPAINGDSHGYWISQGRLVRMPLLWISPGEADGRRDPSRTFATRLEVLAADAMNGTRVSATTLSQANGPRDVVAYIAGPTQSGGDMRARLWIEGAGVVDLSPDRSGASSVALRAVDERVYAVSMDGRSAMSPVHARWIHGSADRRVVLDPDVVVFIGPPPESHTELTLAIADTGPALLVPLSRDATHFGLAILALGWQPTLRSLASWTMYPNGIDPAPVAAAELCAHALVTYARPLDPSPGAGAAVVLAAVEGEQLGPELSVGQGALIADVSLAARDGKSGLLAWVADGRTLVRTIGCP